MIKLSKGAEPQIITDHASDWEQVLIDHVAAGTQPTKTDLNHYNNEETKDALMDETHEKCAYCESKFKHISPGDIEHIVPKKLGPEWRFKWSNLTIACSTCNTNKGVKENLVDPYVDDPDVEFMLCGPVLLPNPDSNKAIVTESAIDLNRKPLVDRRAQRLKNLHRLLIIAQKQDTHDDRQVLLDELRLKETRDDAEFAALSRAYVRELISKGIIEPSNP